MYKALVIEDDVEIYSLEKEYLEKNGFEVSVVVDGEKASKRAITQEYDIALVDINIPTLNGLEVLKRIKEKKTMPVMIVSKIKDEKEMIKAFSYGADDYVTKPFSPNLLVARAKAHVESFMAMKKQFSKIDDVISIRGLTINRTSQKVFVEGVEKNFTSKEFDLLSFLAAHPNKVYSKEELFRTIWDMNSVGDIATVTVHIKKIREKIEEDKNKNDYIETIWGIGYRFKG